MKKLLNVFMLLLGLLLVVAPLTALIAEFTGWEPGASSVASLVVTFCMGLLSKPADHLVGFHRNGVEVEIWVNYIIQRLWKDNLFLKHAFSDDDKVVGGKIVHIPQPGAKPTVVKNRNSFPASAVRRTDTDIVYVLNEYSTDPTHIQDAEKVELSYDKIDSVFGDHAGSITETAGDDMIINWITDIPAGNILRTTGAGTLSTLAGTADNRKAMVHDDLRRARLAMNIQNIPQEDRYALLEENMMDQLFLSLSNTQYRDFSQYADAATGVIGKLYGFKIMTRSSVAVASSALAVKALGAAVAGTDHVASFCWQKNSVARALGEVKFFENPNRAEFYGDVYSSLLRAGGRRRRTDSAGVIAIVQDASA